MCNIEPEARQVGCYGKGWLNIGALERKLVSKLVIEMLAFYDSFFMMVDTLFPIMYPLTIAHVQLKRVYGFRDPSVSRVKALP